MQRLVTEDVLFSLLFFGRLIEMARLTAVSLSALAGVTSALNLTVSSEAGNATSDLQYGIMFEGKSFP